MTVEDLILILRAFPQDAPVVMLDDDGTDISPDMPYMANDGTVVLA